MPLNLQNNTCHLIPHLGPQCQFKGPCTLDPCINGGTCQQTYLNNGSFIYACDCLTGFNGTNCELEINWCDSNPCQNEGSNCTSTTETFICDCGPGYEGKIISMNSCYTDRIVDLSPHRLLIYHTVCNSTYASHSTLCMLVELHIQNT